MSQNDDLNDWPNSNTQFPEFPLEISLVVVDTKINLCISENECYDKLTATPTIPLIECNYSISSMKNMPIKSIYEKIQESVSYKAKTNNKAPTSESQLITVINDDLSIFTTTTKCGTDIKQYMNSCIQYNVISNSGQLYRIKRFRTGHIQIPNVIDYINFTDCEDVISKLIEYESKVFNTTVSRIHPYKIILRNYKSQLTKDRILDMRKVNLFFENLKKERAHIVENLESMPNLEDCENASENLCVIDINNKAKNGVLYITFAIPTNEHNVRIHNTKNTNIKNLSVSVSPSTCIGIYGCNHNDNLTNVIFNYILDIFRSNLYLFKVPEKSDMEMGIQ